jgi:hypothetical protein
MIVHESSVNGTRTQAKAMVAEISRCLLPVLVAPAILAVHSPPALPQSAEPARPTLVCPAPGEQVFSNPPELRSAGGILRGTIVLKDELQRLPASRDGVVQCADVQMRTFRGETSTGEKLPAMRPAEPPDPGLADPEPGPTLRARVGDIVQLTFVNEVNPNNFEPSLDIEKCTEVGPGGELYPKGAGDTYPNCLHASSTANIHFHGTHTNPNSTGDNVYLQIRPLPRDNRGSFTTKRSDATVGFDEFFKSCAAELQNPLNSWPSTWDDLRGPTSKRSCWSPISKRTAANGCGTKTRRC